MITLSSPLQGRHAGDIINQVGNDAFDTAGLVQKGQAAGFAGNEGAGQLAAMFEEEQRKKQMRQLPGSSLNSGGNSGGGFASGASSGGLF